jgi:hypothetical protein
MDFEAEKQLMSPIIQFNESDEVEALQNPMFETPLPEPILIKSNDIELNSEPIINSFSDQNQTAQNSLLPEPEFIAETMQIQLPEAEYIVPTKTTDSFSTQQVQSQFSKTMQSSTVNNDLDIVYQKTKTLEAEIIDIQNANIKDGWLQTNEKDRFEERPTVEPNNLVFEQRKMRMSTLPEWA